MKQVEHAGCALLPAIKGSVIRKTSDVLHAIVTLLGTMCRSTCLGEANPGAPYSFTTAQTVGKHSSGPCWPGHESTHRSKTSQILKPSAVQMWVSGSQRCWLLVE